MNTEQYGFVVARAPATEPERGIDLSNVVDAKSFILKIFPKFTKLWNLTATKDAGDSFVAIHFDLGTLSFRISIEDLGSQLDFPIVKASPKPLVFSMSINRSMPSVSFGDTLKIFVHEHGRIEAKNHSGTAPLKTDFQDKILEDAFMQHDFLTVQELKDFVELKAEDTSSRLHSLCGGDMLIPCQAGSKSFAIVSIAAAISENSNNFTTHTTDDYVFLINHRYSFRAGMDLGYACSAINKGLYKYVKEIKEALDNA